MIKNYFLRHLQTLFFSLGQMARAPLATLMTVAVIGITLALPTGLYLLLDNLQRLSGGWDAGVQISLFLKQDIGDAEAGRIAERLRAREEIESVRYVSRQAALAEFKRLSGFGEALNLLDENPLPAVLLVRPKPAHGSPQAAAALARSLGETRGVDLAQLDLEWVKRLNAMLSLARRGVILLAGLLGLAVLLIVGNTIRLAVLNRRTEIEVVKLIGGTDRFIRRPFLYSGLLQGLAGALTAWLLVALSLALLGGPIADLADLYGSGFRLAGLGAAQGFSLVLGGGLLGWLGSRLAVGRHLREIEPA
ncbi:MAG TPA: permease-like cell division protein FtsX [Acidiferrobacterales bacterium]